MFTSVRSVRATIGRMPIAAHASMRGLTGKQNRYSVPSSWRIRAIAAATVIIVPSSLLENTPFQVTASYCILLVGGGGMPRKRIERQNTSWRISVEAKRLLELMAERLGTSQSALFEAAILTKPRPHRLILT